MNQRLRPLTLPIAFLACSCTGTRVLYIPEALEGRPVEELAKVHPMAPESGPDWWFDRIVRVDGLDVDYEGPPGRVHVLYLEPGEHDVEYYEAVLERVVLAGPEGDPGSGRLLRESFAQIGENWGSLLLEAGREYSFVDLRAMLGWESRPPIVLNLPAPLALRLHDDDVEELFVHKYFSNRAHGPTKHFWHFLDYGAVLEFELPNVDTELRIEGTVHVFHRDAGPEDVGKWLNNQHSDGQAMGAPNPVSFPISSIRIDAVEIQSREVLRDGEEVYDVTRVSFSVPRSSIDGVFTLEPLKSETTVYVSVVEPPLPRIREKTTQLPPPPKKSGVEGVSQQ
ncbi:MAG: hypothetical protein ACYSUF_06895 [Planctomycetota bacterium]|jgi:hypothetical protein